MREGGGWEGAQVSDLDGWVGGKAIHQEREERKVGGSGGGEGEGTGAGMSGLSRRGGGDAPGMALSLKAQQGGPPSGLELPSEALRVQIEGKAGTSVSKG